MDGKEISYIQTAEGRGGGIIRNDIHHPEYTDQKMIYETGTKKDWIVSYDKEGKEIARWNTDYILEIRWKEK